VVICSNLQSETAEEKRAMHGIPVAKKTRSRDTVLAGGAREENGCTKEATYDDAASIARSLNVNKESVWKIIKGMKYSAVSELAMAVHKAFSL
jgi:hypothetical protein